MIQGSPEWFAARCGKVTASRIADMVAKTKSGWGASRTTYAGQLIAQRLTGEIVDGFTTAAMQHGIDTEPQARAAYEFFRNADVVEVGFVPHPSITMAGASPDGLVSDDGCLEIKCPNTATAIETLLGGTVPSRYVLQMQWQMACAGRTWCDFVSFDPRLPEEMRLFVRRVQRDDEVITYLEREVVVFLREIDETIAALRARYGLKEAA